MVVGHRFGRFLPDVDDIAVVLLVVMSEEVGDQQRDVVAAGPQRWQQDRHHVEPVVEIFTKRFLCHLVEQVPVAGGDHPRVDADRLRVTDPLELPLLQHAEELDLELRGGGVDLVEKNRAGVGRLEPAGAVGDCSGKGAADVAEELALQQTLGEGAAVDPHEGARTSRRELVDRPRDELLSGACFAEQQHRGIGAGHAAGGRVDLEHRLARADQPGERRGRRVISGLVGCAEHQDGRRGAYGRPFPAPAECHR